MDVASALQYYETLKMLWNFENAVKHQKCCETPAGETKRCI